jgi:branched-chain amino acid transport system ATP-binding protein
MQPIVELRSVSKVYGAGENAVTALAAADLVVHPGELLLIEGPSGSGKTTLLSILGLLVRPTSGEVVVSGRSIAGLSERELPAIRARTFGFIFQGFNLFPALTALENVKVGVETRQKSGPIASMLGMPWQRREERESTQKAYELLRFVGLTRRANELAGSLAYGEQRRLEIARALGTEPGVILLDEPAAGTNPVEKQELAALIQKINIEDNISVLLIEHDMKLVMSVAHRLIVLNFGEKIAEGTPEQIQKNPAVVAAYLGTSEDEATAMTEGLEVHAIDVQQGVLDEPGPDAEGEQR